MCLRVGFVEDRRCGDDDNGGDGHNSGGDEKRFVILAVITGRRVIMTLPIIVVMQVLTECSGCNYVGDEDRLYMEAVLRRSGDVGDGYSGDVGDGYSGDVGDVYIGDIGDGYSGDVGDGYSGDVGDGYSGNVGDGYSGDENAHDQDGDGSNNTNFHTTLKQKSVIIARHKSNTYMNTCQHTL